jgi:hypothetical protein
MNMNFIKLYLTSKTSGNGKLKPPCGLGIANQRGQAVVELSLMMAFLAVILLALVIIHELGVKNIFAIEALGHEMRVSMHGNAPNPFTINSVQKDVFVDIPGRMKQVFNTPYIKTHHQIQFYEGSYQGSGDSKYNRKFLFRKIDLED